MPVRGRLIDFVWGTPFPAPGDRYVESGSASGHYFSVPMGIEFDAHRVFSLPYLLDLIDERYDVKMFSYVDDAGEVHIDVPTHGDGAEESFGLRMGCGIFTLQKR
jgi:hypothetical protein